jgi:hypothetical protein
VQRSWVSPPRVMSRPPARYQPKPGDVDRPHLPTAPIVRDLDDTELATEASQRDLWCRLASGVLSAPDLQGSTQSDDLFEDFVWSRAGISQQEAGLTG